MIAVCAALCGADDLEQQWSDIVSAITLPSDWQKRIQDLAGDRDQRDAVLRERERVQEKLRRVKQLYRDMMIDDTEYRSSMGELQSRLSTLILPESPHLVQAGEYLQNLKSLWSVADEIERRDIMRLLLKVAYVDVSARRITSIEVSPIFEVLFKHVCADVGVEVK